MLEPNQKDEVQKILDAAIEKIQIHDYSGAIVECDKALTFDEYNPKALSCKGYSLLLSKGESNETLNHSADGIYEYYEGAPINNLYIGYALYQRGEWDKAATRFYNAEEGYRKYNTEQQWPVAKYYWALSYRALGNAPRARALFKESNCWQGEFALLSEQEKNNFEKNMDNARYAELKKDINDEPYCEQLDIIEQENNKAIKPLSTTCFLKRLVEEKFNTLRKDLENVSGEKIRREEEQMDEFIKSKELLFDKTTLGEEYLRMDNYQKRAVLSDDKVNLVLAGPGTGKTDVLVKRILYLMKVQKNPGDRILALAYQKDAKQEIKRREPFFEQKGVDIRTFHSLGMKISGRKYKFGGNDDDEDDEVTDDALRKKFIRDIVNDFKNNEEQLRLYNEYAELRCFAAEEDTPPDKNIERNETVTVKRYSLGKSINRTKFFGENKDTAIRVHNFLLKHNLSMKGNDIHIDVVVVSDGRCAPPSFMLETPSGQVVHLDVGSGCAEKPNRIIIDSIDKTDKAYLIQEITERIRNLGKLPEYSITKRSEREIYDKFIGCYEPKENVIINDISQFIKFSKVYSEYPDDIELRIAGNPERWTEIQRAFANLVLPVFKIYQEKLDPEIDFEDMINLANDKLNENPGEWKNKYDHILIDEFQDISYQRFELIKSIMRLNPGATLFCVGDDWQSIYAFAGGDPTIITDFRKVIGSKVTKIYLKNDYRNSPIILEAGKRVIDASNFGTAKILESNGPSKTCMNKIEILTVPFKKDDTTYEKIVSFDCIHSIKQLLDEGRKPEDILVLHRDRSSNDIINRIFEYANEKNIRVTRTEKEGSKNDKKLTYTRILTAHKSKGLTADVVIILNATSHGFSCKPSRASIFELIHDATEEVLFSEQYRVFFVALTRAKTRVIIYTRSGDESPFLGLLGTYANYRELDL